MSVIGGFSITLLGRVTGKPELIGKHRQFLVCRQAAHWIRAVLPSARSLMIGADKRARTDEPKFVDCRQTLPRCPWL